MNEPKDEVTEHEVDISGCGLTVDTKYVRADYARTLLRRVEELEDELEKAGEALAGEDI